MKLENFGIRLFNVLGRVIGSLWFLVGVGFLVVAFVVDKDRTLYGIVGVLLILAGVGMMVAKRATTSEVSKFRAAVQKIATRRRPHA